MVYTKDRQNLVTLGPRRRQSEVSASTRRLQVLPKDFDQVRKPKRVHSHFVVWARGGGAAIDGGRRD